MVDNIKTAGANVVVSQKGIDDMVQTLSVKFSYTCSKTCKRK